MGFWDELNSVLTMGASKKAQRAAGDIITPYNDLVAPELSPIEYENLVSAGDFTPEQAELVRASMQNAEAAKAGPTEFGAISLDPATREAQMAALRSLQGIADEGMSSQQKLALAKIQADQAASDRGNQLAILQNAAQRGVAGSGLEMMNRMNAQQQSANNRNLQDLQIAAMGDQNKLAALQQIGSLGGNIRGADYEQQAAKAAAADAIAKFNAANTQSMNQFNAGAANDLSRFNASAANQLNQYNTGAMNAAQQGNLANKQNIMNQNVGQRNAAMDYNVKNLPQQQFTNQYNIAGAKSGAFGKMADLSQQEAADNRKTMGNLIQLGATAAGYGGK